MSDQVNLVEAYQGIAYATGESIHKELPNNIPFKKLVLVNTTGSVNGTNAFVNNTVLSWVKIFINGTLVYDLTGDEDADAVPWQIQLLRENNRLLSGVNDTNDYYIFNLPKAVAAGHGAYIDYKYRAVGDLQTGTVAAALTGNTMDILLGKAQPQGAPVRLKVQGGKFAFGTGTGLLANFLNPTEVGYKCVYLMIAVEDNGTASDTAIREVTIKKGTETLQQGSIAKFRANTNARSGLATNTGFAKIPIKRAIGQSDLQLLAEITAAGTAVDLHWQMYMMR